MKTTSFRLFILLFLALAIDARAQNTTFTYQGRVLTNGTPFNGTGLFKFALVNSVAGGSTVTFWSNDGTSVNGSQPTGAGVSLGVTNGLFNVILGSTALANMQAIPASLFSTQAVVQLAVWFNDGVHGFAAITPLQPVTAAPYAAFANSASNLLGTVSLAALPAAVVTNGASGVTLTNGTFSGNGGSLTNLNASQLISGVISTSVLPGFQGPNNYNTVGGGQGNSANGDFSTISGGQFNVTSDDWATVAGGTYNTSSAGFATVSGGVHNTASGQFATVSGGIYNTASSFHDTIGGGNQNTASGDGSTIAGGEFNYAGGDLSFIGGGGGEEVDFPFSFQGNTNLGTAAAIVGGVLNNITTNGSYACIGGGFSNTVTAPGAFIGGGGYDGNNFGGNTVSGPASSIVGGALNNITTNGSYAFIGGGYGNTVNGLYSTISGGSGNQLLGNSSQSFIGGGNQNTVYVRLSSICGGEQNVCLARRTISLAVVIYINTCFTAFSTIAGGSGNTVGTTQDVYPGLSTVGGGQRNTAAGQTSTIAGGCFNYAGGDSSFIGGGGVAVQEDGSFLNVGNTNLGVSAGIVAGALNTIYTNASYAAIGGGYGNIASNFFTTVSGGNQNTASGFGATIPGGEFNVASGLASFAAGQNAHANEADTFVWGDGSREADSQGTNTFAVLATGGVYFYTTGGATHTTIDNTGDLDAGGNVRATLDVYARNLKLTSDRNAKEKFTPVDASHVLDKVAALPVTEWQYKTESGVRHIGPVAQDFQAAFQLSADDKHISPVDEGGVALAAIQGLNEKLNHEAAAKDAQIQKQASEIDELKIRLERLEKLIKP